MHCNISFGRNNRFGSIFFCQLEVFVFLLLDFSPPIFHCRFPLACYFLFFFKSESEQLHINSVHSNLQREIVGFVSYKDHVTSSRLHWNIQCVQDCLKSDVQLERNRFKVTGEYKFPFERERELPFFRWLHCFSSVDLILSLVGSLIFH